SSQAWRLPSWPASRLPPCSPWWPYRCCTPFSSACGSKDALQHHAFWHNSACSHVSADDHIIRLSFAETEHAIKKRLAYCRCLQTHNTLLRLAKLFPGALQP